MNESAARTLSNNAFEHHYDEKQVRRFVQNLHAQRADATIDAERNALQQRIDAADVQTVTGNECTAAVLSALPD